MESSNSNRGFTISVLLIIGLIFICHARGDQSDNSTSTQAPPQNETIYLYLLAIPESGISNLVRLRQEDEDGPPRMSFAQTGQLLGQIIQGVLGGDFRNVFAGSLGFVQEPMAHSNLQSFLGTVSPGLNFAFREFYNRAATRLGFRQTTPMPAQSASQKPAQSPIQEIVYGSNSNPPTPTGGKNISVAAYNGNDLTDEHENPKLPPSSTTSWQFVLNQIYTETTTVSPLPFIRVRSTLAPDDEDYDAKKVD